MRFRPKTSKNQPENNSELDNNNSDENHQSSNQNNNMKEFTHAMRKRKSKQSYNEKFPLNEIELKILEDEKKIVKKFLLKFIANPELSKLNLIDLARVIK